MGPDRFEQLEERYSHLEKAQAELSEVVWRQQRQLDELTRQLKALGDRLQGEPGLVDAARADAPPHY